MSLEKTISINGELVVDLKKYVILATFLGSVLLVLLAWLFLDSNDHLNNFNMNEPNLMRLSKLTTYNEKMLDAEFPAYLVEYRKTMKIKAFLVDKELKVFSKILLGYSSTAGKTPQWIAVKKDNIHVVGAPKKIKIIKKLHD